ncbi:P-loop containing nucleoside triphosphate hydrolases superfamily protein [Perilla frutescens var. hirtella]|nr:P-loop containing nucleoside triphosphate hydrolases superfamily protein [Perilla frutescens var. hirtella]
MAVSMSSMPPASSIFAMYASVSAFIMLIQTMLNQLVPRQAQHYLLDLLRRYFSPRATRATVVIEERDGMSSNEVYSAAETYLCSQLKPDVQRLKISKRFKDPSLSIRFAKCERIADTHDGAALEWRFVNEERRKTSKVIDEDTDNVLVESEKKYFELSFDNKFRDKVLNSYLPLILERAKVIRAEKKVVKLHTLACAASYASSFVWDSINLEHPSTFQTLAMEPEMKQKIVDDLDRFVRRKEFYRRVGRAWKRGYLLYGPPGTGKSSLIAAMANYLKFDIYDLELTNVKRDSDLRKVLLRTANRSILVIEDIDCTVELPERKAAAAADSHCYRPRDHQFTLSGLLNFIDGLWSSCGDERIIVFTTNNKDKLDPALLRPGRMDMHIHMSYLTPDGFNLLASTYLDVQGDDPRLSKIGDLIKGKNVTPAEVAEELMKCDDVDSSLDGVVNFLKSRTNNNGNNNNNNINNNNNRNDGKIIRDEGIEVDKAKHEDIRAKQVVVDDVDHIDVSNVTN